MRQDCAPERAPILVTGSHGLIGRALCAQLTAACTSVRRFDLRADDPAEQGDVLDWRRLVTAVEGCRGIVHLAAVSRIVAFEAESFRSWRTNVDGTQAVITAAAEARLKPWVLVASSREVYGSTTAVPVDEDCAPAPENGYARSKMAAEGIAETARVAGQLGTTVRFSNVYGDVHDHSDRVIPAFLQSALLGSPLTVAGPECAFDFTHVDDVVEALLAIRARLDLGRSVPKLHLVSGRSTTLLNLARECIAATGIDAPIVVKEPRRYGASQFFGSPDRAREVLGWFAQTSLPDGLVRLARAYRAQMLSKAPP